jgi:uncharacterized membrane protein YphA (DoxX/SURF4 family)
MTRDGIRLLTLWSLRVCLCVAFVFVGLPKFRSDPQSVWVEVFDRIGFGDWFRYATGAIETLGGLALLVPRLNPIAVLLLACTMVGAFATHVLLFRVTSQTAVVIALLAGTLGVGWLHWRHGQ